MKRFAAALFVAIFCISYAGAGENRTRPEEAVQIAQVSVSSAEVIDEMAEIIMDRYYKQVVDPRAFAETLFAGNVSTSDPNSNYFSPVQKKNFENSMNGVICGIGVLLKKPDEKSANKFLSIEKVIKDSPAERTGLQAGDYIVAVASDGIKGHLISLRGVNPEKAVWLIRGERGTPVYLRILRKGKILDFLIIRDEIKQELVLGRFVKPGIGYIYLAEFGGSGNDTLNNFSVLVSSMQNNGMKALIWDLRENPGGHLDYAIKMSRWFQNPEDKGPVVVLKSRGRAYSDLGTRISDIVSRYNQGKFSNIPLVVLVDGYSASASEIVAAFLKNYCGVPVIGVRTYKKGTVQSVFSLKNGGALKITIAEYFVGIKEIPVNNVGVEPTIEVKNPKKVSNEKEDAQLQRAIQEAEKLVK